MMQGRAILDQLKNTSKIEEVSAKIKNYFCVYSSKLTNKSTLQSDIEPILGFVANILRELTIRLKKPENETLINTLLDLMSDCVNFMEKHIVRRIKSEKILKILFHVVIWLVTNKLHTHYENVIVHFLVLFDSHCKQYEKMITSLFLLCCSSDNTSTIVVEKAIFILIRLADRISNFQTLSHGANNTAKILHSETKMTKQTKIHKAIKLLKDRTRSNVFLYYLNYYMAVQYFVVKQTELLHSLLCDLLEHKSLISDSNNLHHKMLYEIWKMSIYVESNSQFKLYENNVEWYPDLFAQYLNYDESNNFDENNMILKNSIKMLQHWYSIRHNWIDINSSITLSDKIKTGNRERTLFCCRNELEFIFASTFVDDRCGDKLLDLIYNNYIEQKQYISAFDIKCVSLSVGYHNELLFGIDLNEKINIALNELLLNNLNLVEKSLIQFKYHLLTLHNLVYSPIKSVIETDPTTNLKPMNISNDGRDHLIFGTINLIQQDLILIFPYFKDKIQLLGYCGAITFINDCILFLYLIVIIGMFEIAFFTLQRLDFVLHVVIHELNPSTLFIDNARRSLIDLHTLLVFEVVEFRGDPTKSDLSWKLRFLSESTFKTLLHSVVFKEFNPDLNITDEILSDCGKFKTKSIGLQLNYILQLYTLSNIIFYCPSESFSTTLFADCIDSGITICYSTQILIFTKKLIDYTLTDWERQPSLKSLEIPGEVNYFSKTHINTYKIKSLLLSTLKMLAHSYCLEYGGYNESIFYFSIYLNLLDHLNAIVRIKQSEQMINIIDHWHGANEVGSSKVYSMVKDVCVCTCTECKYFYEFILPVKIDDKHIFNKNLDYFSQFKVISMDNLKFIIYSKLNVDTEWKTTLLRSLIKTNLITRFEMDLFFMAKLNLQDTTDSLAIVFKDFSSLNINNDLLDFDPCYAKLLNKNCWNNVLFKRMCFNVGYLNLTSPFKELTHWSTAKKAMTFNNAFQPSFSNLLHNQLMMQLLCDLLKNSTSTVNNFRYFDSSDQLATKCFITQSNCYAITKLLPLHWKIISMTTKNNIIHLTEWLSNGNGGYLEIQQGLNYDSIYAEFTSIMQENSQSHKITNLKKWWSTRVALDRRLKDCIDAIQHNFFGCIADVLFTNNHSQYTSSYNEMVKNIVDSFPDETVTNDVDEFIKIMLVRIIVEWAIDTHAELKTKKYNSVKSRNFFLLPDMDDKNPVFLKLLNDLHRYFPQYSLIQIKQLVLDANNKINNSCLINTLIEERFLHSSSNYPIILIIDETMCMLPLESMDICFKSKSIVSRMPSMLSLANVLYQQQSNKSICLQKSISVVNSSDTFYILNPKNDLLSTETFFKDTFESIPSWNGICGVIPDRNQYINALSHDVFIYCGHGNGAAYLHENNLRKLNIKGVIFIVGCSSARLHNNGLFDHSGMILQYLASGSSCVVGNLWDVTDKDIDKFLDSTLYHWFNQGCTLPEAINISRYMPKLKYLNGAAPVIYGIPVAASKIYYPKRFPYK